MKKIYLSLAVLFIVISALAKEPTEPKVSKKNQPKLDYTLNKSSNWFTDAVSFYIDLHLPVWGKYTEGSSTNKSYPLACADRKYLTLIHFIKPIKP